MALNYNNTTMKTGQLILIIGTLINAWMGYLIFSIFAHEMWQANALFTTFFFLGFEVIVYCLYKIDENSK